MGLDTAAELKRQAELRGRKIRAALLQKQRAYRSVFDSKSKSLKLVLKDLELFCRADESCFHPDPRMHAVLEGRREVILHIRRQLNLGSDELIEYHRTQQGE